MNALARFEQFVESLVEDSFTRLMRSQLQPVEIAKRIARTMETEQTIAAGKTVVPNDYRVALNPEDFRPFEPSKRSWEQELSEYVSSLAQERGWALFGRPVVTIEAAEAVAPRHVQIAAGVVDRPIVPPAPAPPHVSGQAFGLTQRIDAAAVREAVVVPRGSRLVLVNGAMAGVTYPITKPVLLVGRAMDNDVVLEDAGVSRYHAEIRLSGDLFALRDLRSTNGTTVNGQEITQIDLHDGDHISFAGVDLIFRLGS